MSRREKRTRIKKQKVYEPVTYNGKMLSALNRGENTCFMAGVDFAGNESDSSVTTIFQVQQDGTTQMLNIQ